MTQSELEELSRRAAGCLDRAGLFPSWCPKGCCSTWSDEKAHCLWLHESTEACTEIMVRVLLGPDFLLYGYPEVTEPIFAEEPIAASTRINKRNHETIVWHNECGNDPMLAYRVAVLKALCALKEGK